MAQAFRSYGPGGRFRSSPGRNTSFSTSTYRGRSSGSRAGAKSQLTGCDINIFIKKAQESITGTNLAPTHQFCDFAINDLLKKNITFHGYTTPTPIQDKAIDPILAGRDVIGVAETGTGKTAAFLIPTINKIYKDRYNKALIVAPTRELAFQIREELRKFTTGMPIYSALVIGGANMQRQIGELSRRPSVVIATPGRLKDLIQRRVLTLGNFSIFILDEVDLMVDIGFINDIKYFVNLLPAQRQSLFFSATFSPKVNEVLRLFVRDPVTISVKKTGGLENIEQNVIKVGSGAGKFDQLGQLLARAEFEKVLIFGRTKHGIDKLHRDLLQKGFSVGAIHGDKPQGARLRILDSFKRNEIKILLATDVASRGLDIPNVSHVINYDLPGTYDDYTHRIGRTGRAGKRGNALTFVD